MRRRSITAVLGSAVMVLTVLAWSWGEDVDARGMRLGSPELASIGAITFSPEGTLFIGDAYGAALVAIDLEDRGEATRGEVNVEGIDRRIASLLGTTTDRIRIHDMAVHPRTQNVFLSVSRGGDDDAVDVIKSRQVRGATPHLIRATLDGEVSEVSLENVRFSSTGLRDAPSAGARTRRGEAMRVWSLLEIKYTDGKLYVSGVSNEHFSSTMLQIPFPFEGGQKLNRLHIFHTAHGRFETDAPARVFVPYTVGNETRVFAGFSCTPLVDFALDGAEDGTEVRGKTVAELGAGNHVLDMITVEKDGKSYFLLANHLHPFMMLDVNDVPGARDLTRPTNRAGIDRTPLSHRGVLRLANLGADRVLVLQREGRSGPLALRSIEVSEL